MTEGVAEIYFRLVYSTGAVIESFNGESETLETMRATHPLAVVEAVESSRWRRLMDSRSADRADSPFSTRFLARYPLPPARIVHAYLKRAAKAGCVSRACPDLRETWGGDYPGLPDLFL